MKKIICALITLILVFSLTACSGGTQNDSYIYIGDYTVKVDEEQAITIQSDIADLSNITYTVKNNSDNIAVYGNSIYGLRGGTSSEVTASAGGVSCTFNVTVIGSRLEESKYTGALFNDISVEPVAALSGRNDFIMGADISTLSEVAKNGGRFYNAEGYPESLLLQLKNNGVNYIRVRLWNKPVSPNGMPYGGGNNDIETVKRIAAPAKAIGLKFLLCLHYSDFWADPGKQAIPQDWLNIADSDGMAAVLKAFTKQSVETLKAAGALPDMIQIGNEITSGMLRQTVTNLENVKNESNYIAADSAISGAAGGANFIKYIKAGLEGAKEANPLIKTMIHIDCGANNTRSRNFFDLIQNGNVEYDIIGLSYYSFYHGALSSFTANIIDLQSRYGKKIVVAETSYAFTSQKHTFNSSIFSSSTKNKDWDISPQGQADKIRGISNALAGLPGGSGLGLFYWEPAWLPVSGAGWADAGTLGTWADQGLFSYDGAALPSLSAFNSILGK